jgi:hypothetical protein
MNRPCVHLRLMLFWDQRFDLNFSAILQIFGEKKLAFFFRTRAGICSVVAQSLKVLELYYCKKM